MSAGAGNVNFKLVVGDWKCDVQLNLQQPKLSTAQVQRSAKAHVATVHFKFDVQRLASLAAHQPLSFTAKVKHHSDHSYHIYLGETPSIFSEPRPLGPLAISSVNMRNTQELAALAQRDPQKPLFQESIRAVFELFFREPIPSEDNFAEMVSLVEFANEEDRKRVAERLSQLAKAQILSSSGLMKTLTRTLQIFQRLRLQEILKDPTRFEKNPTLFTQSLPPFNADDLLVIAQTVAGRLDSLHQQESTHPLVCHYLEALIELLDAMMGISVHDVARKETHEKLYQTVAKFEKHRLLPVSFLAEYGKQALRVVNDDESKTHAFFRHGYHFLGGVVNLGGIAANLYSTALSAGTVGPSGVFDNMKGAYKEFKKAFTVHDLERKWFVHLSTIRHTCLEGTGDYLADLQGFLKLHFKGNVEPFFLFGLVRLMEDIIDTRPLDKKTIKGVLGFLQDFWNGNYSTESHGSYTLTPNVGMEWRKQFSQYVFHLVQSLKVHPHPVMAAEATSALQLMDTQLKILPTSKGLKFVGLPSEMLPSKQGTAHIPTGLFDAALKAKAPWRPSFQKMEGDLRDDPQVKEEEDFFIPPDGQLSIETATLLEKHVSTFLAGPEKVMLIKGERGSGKSLFGKLLALKHVQSFETNEFFFIHVSLPRLSNPLKHLWEEVLEMSGLNEELLRAVGKKVVLVGDAYEEMSILENDGKMKLQNLYISNALAKHPLIFKVILTCRHEILSSTSKDHYSDYFSPTPGVPGALKEVTIAGFSPKKIHAYLENYLEMKKLKPDPFFQVHWPDTKPYLDALKRIGGLTSLVANPLLLRVMVEALPLLVKQMAEEQQITEEAAMGKLEVDRTNLLQTFISVLYERERRKVLKNNPELEIFPEHFFRFAVKIAERMLAAQGTSSVPVTQIDPHNATNFAFFSDLFEEDTVQTKGYLRRGCLVFQQDVWTFSHEEFRIFFTTLIDLAGVEEMEELLKQDPYHLKGLALVDS